MELIQMLGRGLRVKIKVDAKEGERLAPGTHKASIVSVTK